MNFNEMFRITIVPVKLIVCLALFLGYAKRGSMGVLIAIENDVVYGIFCCFDAFQQVSEKRSTQVILIDLLRIGTCVFSLIVI